MTTKPNCRNNISAHNLKIIKEDNTTADGVWVAQERLVVFLPSNSFLFFFAQVFAKYFQEELLRKNRSE